MDELLKEHARAAIGFMPEDEGLGLYDAAVEAPSGYPLLEIGSYCGKSSVYLGAAARVLGTVVFSIDHHRGSEEHQPGEEYYDERLVDPASGEVDTLPEFVWTIRRARLADVVIPVVGSSAAVASAWRTPLGLVFVDGGHSSQAAHTDYDAWAHLLVRGGLLAIHDVFEDPGEGGRPPYEVFMRALSSGTFEERARVGSLRVLVRTRDV